MKKLLAFASLFIILFSANAVSKELEQSQLPVVSKSVIYETIIKDYVAPCKFEWQIPPFCW